MKKEKTNSCLTELLYKIREQPGNNTIHQECAEYLVKSWPEGLNEDGKCLDSVYELLVHLFSKGDVRLQAFAHIVPAVLKDKFTINVMAEVEVNEDLLYQFAAGRLFLMMMKKTLNTDYEFETLLVKLRRYVLFLSSKTGTMPEKYRSLTLGIAYQSFRNEYVFSESDEESTALLPLETLMEVAAQKTEIKRIESLILLLGMYRFLYKANWVKHIIAIPPAEFSEDIQHLIRLILYAPIEEEKIKSDIPSYGAISCDTSISVREQYEENP